PSNNFKFILIEPGIKSKGWEADAINYIEDGYNYDINIEQKAVTVRLERPYTTKCINYRLHGCTLREDCVIKCVILNIRKTYASKWPYDVHADVDSSLYFLNYSQWPLEEKLNLQCRNYCSSIDCYNEYYMYQLKSKRASGKSYSTL